MNALVSVMVLQAAMTGLPAEVLDAFNRINWMGYPGPASIELKRVDPDGRTTQMLYVRDANGDFLVTQNGFVRNAPAFTMRAMRKGKLIAHSVGADAVFETMYWPRTVDWRAMPRMFIPLPPGMALELTAPLEMEDILAVERCDEGTRERYRIVTNIRHGGAFDPVSKLELVFDRGAGRIVETGMQYGGFERGRYTYALSYDEGGNLVEIAEQRYEYPPVRWIVVRAEFGPEAAPSALQWKWIGLSVGAFVLLTPSDTPGRGGTYGHWDGTQALDDAAWQRAGLQDDPQVERQHATREYLDALTYEYATKLYAFEVAKWRVGGAGESPWSTIALELQTAMKYGILEAKRAQELVSKAKLALPEPAASGNLLMLGARDALEFLAMHGITTDKGPRRAAEVTAARRIFRQLWSDLKGVKAGDYSVWDARFKIHAGPVGRDEAPTGK